jgi:hypothetical protein
MTALFDDLLDEGGAALLQQVRGEHHCPACSGSDRYCPDCDYLLDLHRGGVCPDEVEARGRWGR